MALTDFMSDPQSKIEELTAQLQAAQAEAEKYKQDAERYRWRPRETMPTDDTKIIVHCFKHGVYDTTGRLAWMGRGDSKWVPIAWMPCRTSTEVQREIEAARGE